MSPLLLLDGRRERGAFMKQHRQYNAKVKCAIRTVRRGYKHLVPSVVAHKFFGAAHVAPEHLTICLFYKHDHALYEACEKGYFVLLRGALIVALREDCYSGILMINVQIEFLSQQAVKDAGGFWAYWH